MSTEVAVLTPLLAHAEGLRPAVESVIGLLATVSEGACVVERGRGIVYWNARAEELTGFGGASTLGRPCAHGLLGLEEESGAALCAGSCPVAATLADGQVRDLRVRVRRRDGSHWPAELRLLPIFEAESGVSGVIELLSERQADDSARVRLSELRLALAADPLTGLPNRRFAELALDARLNELRHFGWPMGALLLDVDLLGSVNDRYGRAVGDGVLAHIARTAGRHIRETDTLCRWDGDELLALVSQVNAEQLRELAEKIRALVASTPVRLPQGELPATVSVAAALGTRDESAAGFLARLDHLLVLARSMGGDQVALGAPKIAPLRARAARSIRRTGVLRVLLVDDHAVVRQGLAALLGGEAGLAVIGEAVNGREGVELADALVPDVILMDANMPVMDGIEATRLIHERHPAVRVIGLSVLADTEVGQRMARAGASRLVSKAASARELLRVIRGPL